MKYFSLFLFTLLFSFNLQSQSYRPFPTNNARWIYHFTDEFGNYTKLYRFYHINGDTTIAATAYKRFFRDSVYFGGIRESNKKIYFLPDTASAEYLLYDFNFTIGDSFYNKLGNDKRTGKVIQTDSTLAKDGFHRTIRFFGCADWIEGIGNPFDFFTGFFLCSVSGDWTLVCYTVDNNLVYPETGSSCNVSIQASPGPLSLFKVSPNPFHETTLIQAGKGFEDSEICIYNAQGMLLRKENTGSLAAFVFERKALVNGIYFIQMVNKRGQVKSAKLLLE